MSALLPKIMPNSAISSGANITVKNTDIGSRMTTFISVDTSFQNERMLESPVQN